MFTGPVTTSTPTALALLVTLKVIIMINDISYIVKALVVQGSHALFIPQNTTQLLSISQRKAYVDISVVGGNKSISQKVK